MWHDHDRLRHRRMRVSSSHIIIDPSPPPCHPRAKSGCAGNTPGKGKQREIVPPVLPEASGNGNGDGSEQGYERGLLTLGRQLSERPAELQELVHKNKNRTASSKEMGSSVGTARTY